MIELASFKFFVLVLLVPIIVANYVRVSEDYVLDQEVLLTEVKPLNLTDLPLQFLYLNSTANNTNSRKQLLIDPPPSRS